MRAWSHIGRRVGPLLLALGMPAAATAQTGGTPQPAPAARIAMADAVRLALEHNHQLLAQRLNVDISKADEITAALKPNPVVTSTNASFPVFSPSQLTLNNIENNQSFVESLSYLFERGGKRNNRTLVARDTTDVAAKTAADAERQLAFQTRQAFISVLLAKSSLDLAEQDLQDFSNVVEVNRQRLNAGDLAQGDFYKISLQKLQFEQDVSAAEVALVQAKATLRQSVGFEAVTEDFDVDGDLAYVKQTITLDDLKRDALVARPDLLAAQSSTKLAQDTHALNFSNRALDVTGEVEYDRAGPSNGMGFGFSIPLPFHDRNQGNIAHSQVAIRQATETETQARAVVLTDVVSAYAAFQTNEKVVLLYQSGYLDQAQQSLDITNYVYQQGSGSLLDLLDAERTNRATQLAYRQALAAYMTSAEQLNFVVGKQVPPMRSVALTMFAAFVLSGCGSSSPPPAAGSAASTSAAANTPGAAPDATYFTVPADQLPHLKLLPVRKTTWSATIHTTGTVDWDNDHTTQAITQVSGPITRILVDTGSRVKVGDPLLNVASSDMTTAISTYRKAKNRFDLAQRTLTRSRDLLEHKAISQRDLESAEADANDASTDLQSALQTLKIFGVAQEDIADAEHQNTAIRPEMTMRAPLAGTIVQKMVLPGQFIQAGMTAAFTISNTATVWVQGHVYDKDLTSIHAGDKVDLSHQSFPQMFHGTLSYIGDLIDPATRTTSVRIVTQNTDGELKKDMFLDVVIHDKTSRDVLVVPTAAVLHDEENFPFVYAQAGPGKFAKRLVKAGDQQGDDTEIVGGLEPGDMVVSDGSVFLQFANTYQ